MVQSPPQMAWPSHCSPDSVTPLPHTGGIVVEVVVLDVEVVVLDTQPPAVHESQALGRIPTQALTLPCGRHAVALRLRVARVTPWLVRQHTTAPGLPQVERAAQRRTAPRHARLWRAAMAASF